MADFVSCKAGMGNPDRKIRTRLSHKRRVGTSVAVRPQVI
jgi:hypothetical protein